MNAEVATPCQARKMHSMGELGRCTELHSFDHVGFYRYSDRIFNYMVLCEMKYYASERTREQYSDCNHQLGKNGTQ